MLLKTVLAVSVVTMVIPKSKWCCCQTFQATVRCTFESSFFELYHISGCFLQASTHAPSPCACSCSTALRPELQHNSCRPPTPPHTTTCFASNSLVSRATKGKAALTCLPHEGGPQVTGSAHTSASPRVQCAMRWARPSIQLEGMGGEGGVR